MKYGVAYRDNRKSAWKIARYPLNNSRAQAGRLIDWLRTKPGFAPTEMRVCTIEFDELRKAAQ